MKMEQTLENTIPIFDPQKVFAMIRAEFARGHHPASLLLGQREAASYRQFLRESHVESMVGDYFYGLEVVQDPATTKMALVGDKGVWND